MSTLSNSVTHNGCTVSTIGPANAPRSWRLSRLPSYMSHTYRLLRIAQLRYIDRDWRIPLTLLTRLADHGIILEYSHD